jgi:hypothetical protein
VDVAELSDAHAVKGGMQTLENNVAMCDLEPVTLNLDWIERQPADPEHACLEEATPGDGRLGDWLRRRHIQFYPILFGCGRSGWRIHGN